MTVGGGGGDFTCKVEDVYIIGGVENRLFRRP